ncbi:MULTISPECIES: glutathione-disulfide reductase [Pseudoxanthomonas]|uniref:Glutathione reductase (NADPH) n=1 Tax=Pseudoxanthomonas winnipegensis TaxID=2480810 RepID=A0AAW8GEQ6_9GAMM|nr:MULTISPECIES: glutathione-disulfide reductase [Pseudoxanthomonas]MDQ1119509.1 glutathione reductase (NADPH) [Pseudoxanthomonas winnipegensis]MDQ1132703.1 glutathione reductase (NADPH) [Pseudoxanthomonas winnipegensis]MDR6137289.1 glutathione reductase (NADPH) [Pseudoxanthomonas sp. SORGH_AS_0997]
MQAAADSAFDLIVIGGGSGGLAGAFRAAEYGASVALLEPGELGGTCVNVGCVPKKAMWLAAEIARHLDMAADLGFPVEHGPLDWQEFVVHRQRYIAGIHDSYRRRLHKGGINRIPSRGRLMPGGVRCEDGLELKARHVLIATGGHPKRPDIPGAELAIDSDGFFNLCSAPPRVAIIGGGYIAVELAGVLQALGSQVELFVRGPCLLQAFDRGLTHQLAENLRQGGIRLFFDMQVTALERHGQATRVLTDTGPMPGEYDCVIFATGRTPNTHDLGLETVGVRTDDEGYVQVDEWQDTNVENIHAIGDVTDVGVELTPVAIAAARRLMDRLFGGKPQAKLDYANIPSVVFSHPPMGGVGLSEKEAQAKFGQDAVKVYSTTFRPMLYALADAPQHSLFRLVCAGPERRVVGVHLMGEGADEILQGFAVAVKLGATLDDLHETVAIHPTSAEEVVLLR